MSFQEKLKLFKDFASTRNGLTATFWVISLSLIILIGPFVAYISWTCEIAVLIAITFVSKYWKRLALGPSSLSNFTIKRAL